MSRALTAAEPFLKAGKNTCLVHVGSGISALGERREDVLAKRIPVGVRYVGVGVGNQWVQLHETGRRTQSRLLHPDQPRPASQLADPGVAVNLEFASAA